ncbi:MAG: TauD/TfdA family dioxygenase [Gemmataceae bacterium]
MSDTNSKNLPGPFSSPAAWRGEELFARNDWLYELKADDIEELEQAHSVFESKAIPVEETTKAHFPLGQFGERLAQLQHDLENGSGGCMVRGLPVAQYTEEQTRCLFWGIASHVGTPISQSAKGERIFNVRDEGYVVGQPQARGPNTKKRLSFHTDRCDVIAFLCVKQARTGGENQLVSSVTVFNEMRTRRPDLLRVLMQPFYYKRHNVDEGNQKPWIQQPIFSYFEGHFAASYLRVLIDRAYDLPELPDMTPEQREALDCLEEVASDPALHVTFRQEPGDMLFLNNWVTLHRREAFEDYDDPALRRHLLRIWLAVPNSRPLAPEFAANFGSTQPGAIRGGMRPSPDESTQG